MGDFCYFSVIDVRRIAIIDKKKCQAPKKCDYICMKVCPINKLGKECIVIGEDGKPVINEELCIGCGICVKKCPYNAIKIVNLPEEISGPPIHQYGKNAFRLYSIPVVRFGSVVGIVGPNGIGKTTAIKILFGSLIPNFGNLDEKPSKDKVLEFFKGKEMYNYFLKLYNNELKCSFKPQYVDMIPRMYSGKVKDIVKGVDEKKFLEILSKMNAVHILDRDIKNLSGGELQKLAIAISLSKDYNVLFLDEPMSYLDIRERINVSNIVRNELNENKAILVVEHDLLILDYLSDYIHIAYGEKGAYGVFSNIRPVRKGINDYLEGYIRDENVRFRKEALRFEERVTERFTSDLVVFSWGKLKKRLGEFELEVEGGEVHEGEIIGIVGPNGIGKTTFARILAGEIEPDDGKLERSVKISYKPQFISPKGDEKVVEILKKVARDFGTDWYKDNIIRPLELRDLFERRLNELSGGELQRVAIAVCLSREADLYLLDEPTAYLDVEQRVLLSKVLRRFVKNKRRAALVVDHDLLFLDYLADSIMVFEGEPGKKGLASKPMEIREGFNRFLKFLGITVRRDPESRRPRINKPGSQKDREQRERGEYYII